MSKFNNVACLDGTVVHNRDLPYGSFDDLGDGLPDSGIVYVTDNV
jgi:hypothetical protein